MKVEDLVTGERRELGRSSWLEVSQQRIDDFVEATGATGATGARHGPALPAYPSRTSVAPGYLLLSLVPHMIEEVLRLEDRSRGVNYGVDRLRFSGPVSAGGRIRGRTALVRGDRRGDGGVLMTLDVVVERGCAAEPALVAELLALAYD